MISRIKSKQLADYLLSRGWNQAAAPDDFIEIWELTSSDKNEQLLVPTETAQDKAFVVSQAITKLSDIYGKSETDIENQIQEESENTISIRVVHPDVEDGSIPLDDGIALNKNAKEMLIAAANSALEHRSLHQGRPPAPVAELVKHARLGQTAHGSYVIHVFCRTPEPSDTPDLFARRSTGMLRSALAALQGAIEKYRSHPDPLIFEHAVKEGVSANLCDSLISLSGKDRERTVRVVLRSDSSEQMFPTPAEEFEFQPDTQTILAEASDYYRQTYTLSNLTVAGIIERLDRQAENQDGEIRIATTLPNGAQRSVSLQLASDDYLAAIHAHEAKQSVKVTGDVVVTPRTANLLKPADFSVISNGDLFET